MTDEQNLVSLVTRGLAGIQDQLRERDGRVSALSDKVIGMGFELGQVSKTLTKIENEIAQAQMGRLEMRVAQLEEDAKDRKSKQDDNAKWIKGLVASVIILALGFLLNFLRISLK